VTDPRRAPMAVIAVGAIAAATLVGRPVGLGLTATAVALFALARPPRDVWSVVFWLAAAALAAVGTLRAAAWIAWPSLLAAVALASLAAAGGAAWLPIGVAIARATRLDQGLAFVARAATAGAPHRAWRPQLVGAGLGIVLLAVFLPLFATADAAFAHLLGELVPNHALDRPLTRAAVWVAVTGFGGALLVAGRGKAVEPALPAYDRLGRIESAVPLGALLALFAGFVALQLTTLYGGHDYVLRTAGLTYAEYAREGFAQLLAAAALTLAVLAAAVRWARDDRLVRLLLAALSLLTLVVLASALKRLALYMDAYGFTGLRLTAQATILWLAAVFALVLIAGATRRTTWLPRATVALTAAAMLAFALSNPERRVADHNIDRYEDTGRLDRRVLRSLSADASPTLARLPPELAACTTARVRRDLDEPDGVAGFNLSRERARDALRGVNPALSCP
jgi:uncharacterized protein DUF4153